MQRNTFLVALFVALFTLPLLAPETEAFSDRTGVYARVDKVVLEPNAAAPERVQVWGAFAIANKEDRNSYGPAQRGYLYFSLKSGQEEVCRKEWADLKAIAGTGQVIGFGGRFMPLPRVRKADDKPADPDEYPVNFGLVKMSERHNDYSPVRELRSLPRGQN